MTANKYQKTRQQFAGNLKFQLYQENTTMPMSYVCLPGTYRKKQLVTLSLTFCKRHLKVAGTKDGLKKSNQVCQKFSYKGRNQF